MAAARRGARTVLLTTSLDTIGQLSCNPAMGGIAKGTVIREIDALGGVMARATDLATLQFRMLNRGKGPAVWAPRAQADRGLYRRAVRSLLEAEPRIIPVQGTAARLLLDSAGRICGVETTDGRQLRARAVVITTGTFLRGRIHIGTGSALSGGRAGEAATTALAEQFADVGLKTGRFKTGTPPRVDGRSLDLHRMQRQDSEIEAFDYSWSAFWPTPRRSADRTRHPEQMPCFITYVEDAAKALVQERIAESAMYGGAIASLGPRYCPSIEDKVVRFAERESHTIFLEPESLRDDWIYCNGISTSLPADVQDQIVHSMPGCEKAHIYRYGYAVEYDMVRPHQIHTTGMTKLVDGLFLAGQINGTSGYEEAGAQGLIAGINAARYSLKQPEFILRRDQAYIGVLMDDLVTKTPVEPYRMFTSRAEHRLLLRPDNAPDRLTPIAEELGLLSGDGLGKSRRDYMAARTEQLSRLNQAVDSARVDNTPLPAVLRRPEFTVEDLKRTLPDLANIPDAIWSTVHANRKYAAYVERQHHEVRRAVELETKRLPDRVDYNIFTALRPEARQALTRFRPATFGQASRLEGITPADLTLLAVLVKKHG